MHIVKIVRGVKRQAEPSHPRSTSIQQQQHQVLEHRRPQQSTAGANKKVRIMLKFPIYLDETPDKKYTAASSGKAAAELSRGGTTYV